MDITQLLWNRITFLVYSVIYQYMDLNATFDARFSEEGVEFTERDAELLQAIDERHSINEAATALGRSYSRSQQRIVELEDAFEVGALVERKRGGSGGGGSTLTDAARRLLADFDCLRAEFAGVAETEETILSGTVVESDRELGTVETAAGPVRAIIPSTTTAVQVVIRADTVTLHTPGTTPKAEETSARNRFRGEVIDIEMGEALARIELGIGNDVRLTALVTRTSVSKLDLSSGEEVVASFKATATRAFPADRFSVSTDRENTD
jgi:molybdate transport system regulatory protein